MMPLSRGLSSGQDPCQGPSGGMLGAQNLDFSPTRFHEDPEKESLLKTLYYVTAEPGWFAFYLD
jgi:hypothetical protein